ncbi:MAG: DUF3795 domain-containing protein [Candidatus Thorarchaeota archaeon]
MKEFIAYCGINCSECPAYIATQKGDTMELEKVAKEWSSEIMPFKPEDLYCDGCNKDGRIFSWCEECPIRICCQQKGFENCAYCEEYFCDKLKLTFDKTPSAKERLDKIRGTL